MPRNIVLTDNSQNILDPSYNLFPWNNNRHLTDLHNWTTKNNINKEPQKTQLQNNINNNNILFINESIKWQNPHVIPSS